MRSHCLTAAVVLFVAGCGAAGPAPLVEEATGSENEPLVVYLVRHGEKLDDGSDPDLSGAGMRRAEELSRVLGDMGIEHIHSTDYVRTQKTAAPLAEKLGLEVESYDPRNLEELAARLREVGGRHLVVGHSNTTPGMVELLGGDPGSEIDEAVEYDRLYKVVVDGGGGVSSELRRYGVPTD